MGFNKYVVRVACCRSRFFQSDLCSIVFYCVLWCSVEPYKYKEKDISVAAGSKGRSGSGYVTEISVTSHCSFEIKFEIKLQIRIILGTFIRD